VNILDIFNNSGLLLLLLFVIFASIGILDFAGISIPYFNLLQDGIYTVVSPAGEFISYIYDSMISYWQGFFRTREIAEENKKLQQEILFLENQINQLEESLRQNERLGKLDAFLDAFKDFTQYEVKGASVIGSSPTNWENNILLDKGEKDGIKDGMPVISYNGILVGMVINVSANTAQVIKINNPNFAVGGIVQRSRSVGLVRGQSDQRNINIIEKIPEDGDIITGDRILTSGLSNNFPKYLPIGEVIEVNRDDYSITQQAKIDLFIGNQTIEEVLVITDH